jgi:hypothetical protein
VGSGREKPGAVALPKPPGAEHVVRSGRSRPSYRPELALVPERGGRRERINTYTRKQVVARLKSPRRSAVRYGGEPCRLWDSSAPGAASAAVLNTGKKHVACACNILYVEVTLRVRLRCVSALPVFRWTD